MRTFYFSSEILFNSPNHFKENHLRALVWPVTHFVLKFQSSTLTSITSHKWAIALFLLLSSLALGLSISLFLPNYVFLSCFSYAIFFCPFQVKIHWYKAIIGSCTGWLKGQMIFPLPGLPLIPATTSIQPFIQWDRTLQMRPGRKLCSFLWKGVIVMDITIAWQMVMMAQKQKTFVLQRSTLKNDRVWEVKMNADFRGCKEIQHFYDGVLLQAVGIRFEATKAHKKTKHFYKTFGFTGIFSMG